MHSSRIYLGNGHYKGKQRIREILKISLCKSYRSRALNLAFSYETYIPKITQCLSLRLNWDPPDPSPTSECVPSGTKGGGGGHKPAGEGGGGVPLRTTGESTLSTLYLLPYIYYMKCSFPCVLGKRRHQADISEVPRFYK